MNTPILMAYEMREEEGGACSVGGDIRSSEPQPQWPLFKHH
jgi:hypothetical protein